MVDEHIIRKDGHVTELIELMDARLAEAGGDQIICLQMLRPDERAAIDLELARALSSHPEGVRYFQENYFVINTKGEGEVQALQTLFPFKESQELLYEDFLYCWNNGLAVWWILLKARQLGWSTWVQSAIFQRTISTPLTRSLVIADEKDRSAHIFGMSVLAKNKLPWWMRPEVQNERVGDLLHFDRKEAEERINNPGLNSTLYVDAANKPTGSSRGKTLHNLHASEIASYQNPQVLTSDIIPTVPKTNPNTFCVLEGTANESRTPYFRRMWRAAMEGRVRFRPIFAAWWKEPSYSIPFRTAVEREAFKRDDDEDQLAEKVRAEFNYEITDEQLNWRRIERAEFEAVEEDPDQFEQEYPSYPEAAFRPRGMCYFPRKKLKQIEVRDVRPPIFYGDIRVENKVPKFIQYKPPLTVEEAPLLIWEWPNTRDIYYQGSDPSEGISGKDYSALSMFRIPRTRGEQIRQVLEYRDYVPPKQFAPIACSLGHFYNTCELSPEVNTLTEFIGNIRHIFNYPKIYRWRRADKATNAMTMFVGWETNYKSRFDLMTRFRSLMIEDSIVIKSQRLINECSTFVDDGSGRWEATGDNHDDLLFAAMICVYCLIDVDPNVFALVEDPPVDSEGKDFQNTDAIPGDMMEDEGIPDYSML